MEERVISYESNEEINAIIDSLSKQDFLLVKHSTSKKQLFFKKYPAHPESLIISEP